LEIHANIEEQPGELRCPRCKRNDIVLSLPRGIRDMFMEGLGRAPRHCRSCGKRFYVKAAPAREPEDGQA
jgi:transcription elongation factor Elf1